MPWWAVWSSIAGHVRPSTALVGISIELKSIRKDLLFRQVNVQPLNNTGSAAKKPVGARNHTLHAGYERDVGRGEALIGADAGSVREGVLAGQVKKLSKASTGSREKRPQERGIGKINDTFVYIPK